MFIPTREEPGMGKNIATHFSDLLGVSDHSAVIFQPAPSAMTSGRRHNAWTLRFERRTPQYVEPLMGWTSDGDPLATLELQFESLASAIAYARRQGLRYRVQNSVLSAG